MGRTEEREGIRTDLGGGRGGVRSSANNRVLHRGSVQCWERGKDDEYASRDAPP